MVVISGNCKSDLSESTRAVSEAEGRAFADERVAALPRQPRPSSGSTSKRLRAAGGGGSRWLLATGAIEAGHLSGVKMGPGRRARGDAGGCRRSCVTRGVVAAPRTESGSAKGCQPTSKSCFAAPKAAIHAASWMEPEGGKDNREIPAAALGPLGWSRVPHEAAEVGHDARVCSCPRGPGRVHRGRVVHLPRSWASRPRCSSGGNGVGAPADFRAGQFRAVLPPTGREASRRDSHAGGEAARASDERARPRAELLRNARRDICTTTSVQLTHMEAAEDSSLVSNAASTRAEQFAAGVPCSATSACRAWCAAASASASRTETQTTGAAGPRWMASPQPSSCGGARGNPSAPMSQPGDAAGRGAGRQGRRRVGRKIQGHMVEGRAGRTGRSWGRRSRRGWSTCVPGVGGHDRGGGPVTTLCYYRTASGRTASNKFPICRPCRRASRSPGRPPPPRSRARARCRPPWSVITSSSIIEWPYDAASTSTETSFSEYLSRRVPNDANGFSVVSSGKPSTP